MMNPKHAPAYTATPLVKPLSYQVVATGSDSIDLQVNQLSDLALVQGLRVELYNASNSLVTEGLVTSLQALTKDRVQLKLLVRQPGQLAQAVTARLKRSWTPMVTPIEVVSTACFTSDLTLSCSLVATAQVPADYTAGLLSWTLFYNNQPMVKGHDFQSPASCYFTHAGYWQVGSYWLKAQRRHSTGNVVCTDQRKWTLDHPSERLSCGGYNDVLTALMLS